MTSTDHTGKRILEVIAEAGRFNKWMYQTIKPFVTGKTLEIGSGIGNLSAFFLKDNIHITLSDIEEDYIITLNKRFGVLKTLESIISVDLEKPYFETTYFTIKEKFDTVILLNVLEHIEDDKLAIRNSQYLLKPGGKIIILTPAYNFLYSSLDRSLGHYRRYTTQHLKNIFKDAGYKIENSFYFNFIGIFAWLYGKILGLKLIPKDEMKVFNLLVTPGKIADKIIFRKAGLSAIIVARKESIKKCFSY